MAKTKGRDSWRSKEWYEIVAPEMFGSQKIGETMASEPEQVKGRVLEITLRDLIDDYSKSHVKLYFKVKEIDDHKAITEFAGHDMARGYIRSQIRRRASKIDCVTDVTTSNNRKLRINAIAVTLRRVQSSHKNSIRSKMEETIQERARKLDFDQFVQEVSLGKLASDIYKRVKEICPVRRVEVKKSKLLGEES
ncbi:MAG: 30S ribosomal protein S3ae [Hadesarchaea archaeon]|nr:30S ribosomal protein S3ae [Hadesarchaea archaeon]